MTMVSDDLTLDPVDGAPRRRGSWRRAAAVSVIALVVVAAAVGLRPHESGLAKTRAALASDSRFANGPKAGSTFADISRWLLADGQACQRSRSATDHRCRLRLSASAYAGVSAFILVDCTSPGVFQARAAMRSYIDQIETFDRRPLGSMPVPSLPNVPTC